MSDPVEATDGYTYERKSILDWFRKYGALSPVTRESLSSQDVKPNDKLRQTIEKAMASTAAVGEKKTAADAEAVVCHDVITIRELDHIFAHLDPVRPVLNRTLADWKPPQVVVIGQERSERKLLLERISMMSILPEDEAAMEREVEWEAAPGLPQAPAAAAADPTTPATPPSTSPDAPP